MSSDHLSAISASPFRAFLVLSLILILTLLLNPSFLAQQSAPTFVWPNNARTAISLSFDDARTSQVDVGTALLDRYGVKATFFVVPPSVEQRLAGWKAAVAAGHEIGNHSLTHPCSGNFPWSRQKAIEDYSLEKMRAELVEANERIRQLLGVTPETFAYPCGQTYVGRGLDTRSYVPLVAGLFTAGRGWLGEAPNDPVFCDLAQLTGMELDGKDIDQIMPIIEQAKQSGFWLVLAGHEIGRDGRQTTRVAMLEQLLKYARDPANGVWIAPVGTVARYIREKRNARKDVGMNSASVVQAIPPGYPPLARLAGVSGEVTVEITINSQGTVNLSQIIDGHRLLGASAENAARRWKFNPVAAEAKERTVQLHFQFTLIPPNKGTPADLGVSFWPPYKLEVRDTVYRAN